MLNCISFFYSIGEMNQKEMIHVKNKIGKCFQQNMIEPFLYRLPMISLSTNPTHLEIKVEVEAEDDWGFYIDIESHDWTRVGTFAPIKIQVNNLETTSAGIKIPPTKEEIQRHINMSFPKEMQPKTQRHTSHFNLNVPKIIAVTITVAAICAFY